MNFIAELLDEFVTMYKSTLDLFDNNGPDESSEIDEAFDSALEEKAAALEVTVDYYIAEFL